MLGLRMPHKARAIESFAFDAGLLGPAEQSVTPERTASDEELFGREFEVSVFLGNENTRGVIPLKELRLRFCEEPIDAAELGSARSRALEVVTDPWFISMDGKQEVRVSHARGVSSQWSHPRTEPTS